MQFKFTFNLCQKANRLTVFKIILSYNMWEISIKSQDT